MIKIHIILPSLKVSGGTLEALRLGGELSRHLRCQVDILTLWQSPHPLDGNDIPVIPLSKWKTHYLFAAFQFPVIAVRFFLHLIREKFRSPGDETFWIYTHYSTLPLAFFTATRKRLFFVQGLEWTFASSNLVVRILKCFIFFTYRRGTVITANDYLARQLEICGMPVSAVASIWADQRYCVKSVCNRDIDVVMVVRKGIPKRPDMYRAIVPLLRKKIPNISIAVITPEDDIAKVFTETVDVCLLRPDLLSMSAVYARSRIFLFLSENEGFGLPPLEAMGAGCVPLCRDCGGVRAYMTGALESLLIPLELDIEGISDRVQSLLADDSLDTELTRFSRLVFDSGLERARNRVKNIGALFKAK